MITISKGKLKAKMLEYFRQIEKTGETLIVTDHNRPALQINSIKTKVSIKEAFSDLQGKFKSKRDLLKPETDDWGSV